MQLFRDFYYIVFVKPSVLNSQIQANIYLLRYICSVISDTRRSVRFQQTITKNVRSIFLKLRLLLWTGNPRMYTAARFHRIYSPSGVAGRGQQLARAWAGRLTWKIVTFFSTERFTCNASSVLSLSGSRPRAVLMSPPPCIRPRDQL